MARAEGKEEARRLRMIAIWSQLLLPLFSLLPQHNENEKKKFARQGKFFFQPFSHFFLSFSPTPDPEYKLKSANQTPTALSNALTNNHEISRNIIDERKAYIKGVSSGFYRFHAMSPC
jgi:hypothetical protein